MAPPLEISGAMYRISNVTRRCLLFHPWRSCFLRVLSVEINFCLGFGALWWAQDVASWEPELQSRWNGRALGLWPYKSQAQLTELAQGISSWVALELATIGRFAKRSPTPPGPGPWVWCHLRSEMRRGLGFYTVPAIKRWSLQDAAAA